MAWIESHQEIARHPKTRKLARLAGMSVPQAIGHLHLLWWWSVDYAPDGWLGRYTKEDIADACMWEGDPQALWDALLGAGWFDAGGEGAELHDWPEYAGRLIEQRRKDAERKRESRHHSPPINPPSGGRPSDVQAPSGVTVPNLTVPNLTGDDPPTPQGGTAPAGEKPKKHRPKKATAEDIENLVAEFTPEFGGGEPAVRAEIARALNSTASLKWIDQKLGLKGWLRRDVDQYEFGQTKPTPLHPPGRNGSGKPLSAATQRYLAAEGMATA